MYTTLQRIAFMMLGPLLTLVLLLSSCSTGSPGGSSNTVTGSVTDSVGTQPLVGLFDGSTYQFYNNTPTSAVDLITSESGGPSTYTPLQTVTPSGGNYSLTLPAGTSGAEYLVVAWDDTNSNGKWDSGTENGYFPVKSFPEGSTAMLYITFASYMGQGEYAAGYYISPTNYIEGFSTVGRSGYSFSIR